MGDRICIKITNGDETTPIFYGHWCGLKGLKVMIETIHEPANSLGGIMCNFIVKIMEGKPQRYSFDIWNDGDGEDAANGDWCLWTYHTRTETWTTTYPPLRKNVLTEEEIHNFIKTRRPCLYRECKCEHYGEKTCWQYYYETKIKPMEERMKNQKEGV